MRQLKFKAWDKTDKFMTDPFSLGSVNAGDGYDDEWVVLQFTGVLDKNGKEIFEGDVVSISAGYSGDHWYEKSIAKIIYDEFEFYPENPHDEYGLTYQENPWQEMTVIGNVYENPELLDNGQTAP